MRFLVLAGGALALLAPLSLRAEDAPPKDPTKDAPVKVAADDPELENKVSYIIGNGNGQQLKEMNVPVNIENFTAGLKDGLSGAKPRFAEAEVQAIMTAYQGVMRARMAKANEDLKKKNVEWLAENGKKDGWKTLPSGLEYKELKAGTGDSPKATDTVKCHYAGSLTNGTEFDSSYKRGEPVDFPVTGVIKGWTEALLLMKPGAKWQLAIPSDLAYGDEGRQPRIPPCSVLLFDIELLQVVTPEAAPKGPPGGGEKDK